MKCNICNKQMSHCEFEIHSGVDWYPRQCVSFNCNDCKYCRKYLIETNSKIIKLMLISNISFLNKLALLLADNYQMTDGYVIERDFKPHSRFKKWLKGVKE